MFKVEIKYSSGEVFEIIAEQDGYVNLRQHPGDIDALRITEVKKTPTDRWDEELLDWVKI